VTLAIFDLDGTLLSGDSDYNWGQFLVEEGIVDASNYKAANDKFYQDYLTGSLDIHEYLAFSLAPLTHFDQSQLVALHHQFMHKKIAPMMQDKALKLIQEHKEKGHFLMIITATNAFVTSPISQLLGMDHLIAPMPEIKEGRYTGAITGIPSFQAGKVTRLNAWLEETGNTLEGSYFYSDSHNDLPLLELVTHPIVVDADAKLTEIANQRNWLNISLRD
jgi:HAD superfamily hydrolase (TIGR01490 family)